MVVAGPEKVEFPTVEETEEKYRWGVPLELVDGQLAGASVIVLFFNADELSCRDGSNMSPADLRAGDTISFAQEGEISASDPPLVGGRDFVARAGERLVNRCR